MPPKKNEPEMQKGEVHSMNAIDLSIEELESRLELASPNGWWNPCLVNACAINEMICGANACLLHIIPCPVDLLF
jgi:hypothetical protein